MVVSLDQDNAEEQGGMLKRDENRHIDTLVRLLSLLRLRSEESHTPLSRIKRFSVIDPSCSRGNARDVGNQKLLCSFKLQRVPKLQTHAKKMPRL
jgi:hypothetical protein